MPATETYVAKREQTPGARPAHKKRKREEGIQEAQEIEPGKPTMEARGQPPSSNPCKQVARHKQRHYEEFCGNYGVHNGWQPSSSASHTSQKSHTHVQNQRTTGNSHPIKGGPYVFHGFHGYQQSLFMPAGNIYPKLSPGIPTNSHYGHQQPIPNGGFKFPTNASYGLQQLSSTADHTAFRMAYAGLPTHDPKDHQKLSCMPLDNTFAIPALVFPTDGCDIYEQSFVVSTGNTFTIPSPESPVDDFYCLWQTSFTFGSDREATPINITVRSNLAESSQASHQTQSYIIEDPAIVDRLEKALRTGNSDTSRA
ncbi:hypothetical protein MMC18_003208 [Xylographa bjoerkii]|nr:hypothetical protein [Xylographa bjoerkii]